MSFYYDDENGFLCYKTKPEEIEYVINLYNLKFPDGNKLNRKTVYNRKESRIAGLLGEYVFHLYLPNAIWKINKSLPYDFVVYGPNDLNIKVDVKCKYRKVTPKPYFEASIYNYQASSEFFGEVDYYAFLSTSGKFEKVWFCGMISKTDLVCSPDSVLWKKGQVDPSNNKVFHEDTLSTFYKNLAPFRLQ